MSNTEMGNLDKYVTFLLFNPFKESLPAVAFPQRGRSTQNPHRHQPTRKMLDIDQLPTHLGRGVAETQLWELGHVDWS